MNEFNPAPEPLPKRSTEIEPLTYTRYEAAKRSGMSVSNLDRKVKAGQLIPIRDGRKVLFERKYIDKWSIDRGGLPTNGGES